jgi:predicted Holliday junction resolvase-like endonuclease
MENLTFKGLLLILFQVTLVITISVLQFVFSKLQMIWNFAKEKLLSFYKKKEIEKYVNEANETYSNLNMENHLKVLKESLNEKFANIQKKSLKFVPEKVSSLFVKNS